MATSKTLTPTNVTIQIPEFTDQPDQRVNSNCLDKEADAINALDGHFSTQQIAAYGLSIKAVKVFNIIIISVDGVASSDVAQWTSFGTLNTGFRPTVGSRDFTGASLRANVNGAINNPTAINNGARVSGYCVYADS